MPIISKCVAFMTGRLRFRVNHSCVLGVTVDGGRGEMMLVEDTGGKGHRVEVLDGPPFRAEFVAVKRPGNFVITRSLLIKSLIFRAAEPRKTENVARTLACICTEAVPNPLAFYGLGLG